MDLQTFASGRTESPPASPSPAVAIRLGEEATGRLSRFDRHSLSKHHRGRTHDRIRGSVWTSGRVKDSCRRGTAPPRAAEQPARLRSGSHAQFTARSPVESRTKNAYPFR